MLNQDIKDSNLLNDELNLKEELLKYFSYWPYFLISIILSLACAYLFLRYSDKTYMSEAKIEIIDKSQDSEMALPTAMTIFNRSMINLENEIGVLKSYRLHEKVVLSKNFNVKFYSIGTIKTTLNHPDEWFEDYSFELIDDNEILDKKIEYYIDIDDKNNLIISKQSVDGDKEFVNSFNGLTTKIKPHKLPFEIEINKFNTELRNKKFMIMPVKNVVQDFIEDLDVQKAGKESDQLVLEVTNVNPRISEDYLNELISAFNNDGIQDRQLEYKRTIEFVDSRSSFLLDELEVIELRKQKFKEKNKLSDIKSDASMSVQQQYSYDSELFEAESQKDLADLLEKSINKLQYKLLPVNIGLNDNAINELLSQYNLLIKERDRSLLSAGQNNLYVKSLNKQILDFKENILSSIKNYIKSLEVTISNIQTKEREFENLFQNIPENEKILRSIERELEIKESLFLLLLQKKEEAAINFAVIKPSIKIIDYAQVFPFPIYPRTIFVLLSSLAIGFLVPLVIVFIFLTLDTKIHVRDHITKSGLKVPLVGEIPHVNKLSSESILAKTKSQRNNLEESIRILLANLNFIKKPKDKGNLILVTSSIKGEGKTLISVGSSKLLSQNNKKVLLVGADLRNPQIHKFINKDKSTRGLSDHIYLDGNNWKDLILKDYPFDILLSGTIPPNPTELLATDKFRHFLDDAKKSYDYIVVDSAPCLLVSDTFEISNYSDLILYVIRSNYTDKKLLEFINECSNGKMNDMSLVLNAVGQNNSYNYSYGYKYDYRYKYNYGYGYGYNEDE
tara:strand:+ start:14931 stop:17297 length:2367 start_codon:yes stop_codon:yes gene_type:complete